MSSHQHLNRKHYDILSQGDPSAKRLILQLFEHLLEVCPTCRRAWNEAASSSGRPYPTTDGSDRPAVMAPEASPRSSNPQAPSSQDAEPQIPDQPKKTLDDPFARVLGRASALKKIVDKDREQAGDLLQELLSTPNPKARVAKVRREKRFQSWGLCERLFSESHRTAFSDLAQAKSLAELSIEAAWSLDNGRHSNNAISDLLTRGWGALANARRMSSDLEGAEETFSMAAFFLEQGTGDPLVLAEHLSLEASLRRDQRHLDVALRLLDRVLVIYRRTGEDHLQGRTLLSKAITISERGDSAAALEVLEKGITLIDETRNPRLTLCFHHTKALFLNRTGRHEEAFHRMQELAPLFDAFPDAWTQLRRRWLAGEIAESLGRDAVAEREFLAVRQGFVEQGVGYDAALASLHLAALYLRQGRTQEIKELASEMFPIFQSRDIHREAIASLLLFQKAAQLETVTTEMLQSLRQFLEQARGNTEASAEVPS